MPSEEPHVYRFKSFRLDLAERQLLQDGTPLAVTPKAFDLLALLVARAGHLVEKEELMQTIWPDSFVEETNLTRIIHTLRKTLGHDDNGNRLIETVSKRGYRFVGEVTMSSNDGETGRVELDRPYVASGDARSFPHSVPASRPPLHAGESRAVVALADWRRESEPAETTKARQRSDLTLARPVVKNRGKLVVLAAATLVLGAIGLGYFLFAERGGEAIDSVAVLPFVNATGDSGTDYLSEGISDSIINSLMRLPNVKVNSLNSVLPYKGKQVDLQTVGRELNVRAVLMGTLTKKGDGLAISAELVDVRDRRRLWGGQYSTKLSDILAVQDEMARQISDGLRLRLSGDEKELLAKQDTANTDAYLLYSLGKYYGRQNTKEALDKSVRSFEEAVEIDPNYARAFAGLAGTYQFMMSRGFLPPKEYDQKVEWAALKALQLDDTLADAHASLGSYKLINFDWAGAEKEIRRALDLDPRSAKANSTYAHYLLGIGRADESLAYTIRAQELDPIAYPGASAFAYFVARQYDKAIESYRKNIERRPDNAQAQILLGEAYVANGMPEEGVAQIEKGMAFDKELDKTPERWDRYPLLAYAYAMAGRRDQALKILEEQHQLANASYVSPYNFAIIYTALGDKDRAFEWLTKCVEQRIMIIYHLKTRPLFDTLRSDPRYPELLRKMNLEP